MRERIYNVIEVNNHTSLLRLSYDYFMIFCIALSILPLFFKTNYEIFNYTNKFTVTVFIIDYALRWITADFKFPNHGIMIFVLYPFTPFAIVDLLSMLPSIVSLNRGFRLFRILRLSNALKIIRFLRYSKQFEILSSVIKKERNSLMSVCALAGGYILIAAILIFQVEPETFDTFFDAFYWAIMTLTAVGYGDLYPVTDIGRIIAMLSSLVGIAIVALPAGIISAGYVEESTKNKDDSSKQ